MVTSTAETAKGPALHATELRNGKRPTGAANLEDLKRRAVAVQAAAKEYNMATLEARRAGLDVKATLRKLNYVDQQILTALVSLPFTDPEDDVDEVVAAVNREKEQA